MKKIDQFKHEISDARISWINLKNESFEKYLALYKPGSGFGDKEAKYQAEQEAYHSQILEKNAYEFLRDLEKQELDLKIYELQKSQTRSNWITMFFGILVGTSTIISTIIAILAYLNSLKG